MAALPPNPLAVALPAPPKDHRVSMPAAPHFPPTVNDVLRARRYRKDVKLSLTQRPVNEACTRNDLYNSIIYEHSIVAQAAAAGPQATPPWFQAAIQQLRNEMRNDIQQCQDDIQQCRDDIQNDIQQLRDDIHQLRDDIIPDIKQGRREGNRSLY